MRVKMTRTATRGLTAEALRCLHVGKIEVPSGTNISNRFMIHLPAKTRPADARERLNREMSDLEKSVIPAGAPIDRAESGHGVGFMRMMVFDGFGFEGIVLGSVRYAHEKAPAVEIVTYANPTANNRLLDYFQERGVYPLL
jgi:hypothetical protein